MSSDTVFIYDVLRSHCCDLDIGLQVCKPYMIRNKVHICVSLHVLKYIINTTYERTITLADLANTFRSCAQNFPGGNGKANVADKVSGYCYYFGIRHFKSMVSIGKHRFIHIEMDRLLDHGFCSDFKPKELILNVHLLNRKPFICRSLSGPYNTQGENHIAISPNDEEARLFTTMSLLLAGRMLEDNSTTDIARAILTNTIAELKRNPGYLTHEFKYTSF